MAISSEHVLHGIFNGSTFVSQIENARSTPGIDVLLSRPAGFPEPLFVANQGQRPGVSFESPQVKTLLDLVGVTGIANLSAANTDLYFKKAKHLAAREAAASSVHTRLRAAQAGLVVNRISAGHRQLAMASCQLLFPYDGTNEPIVPAGSQTLSGTPTAAENFLAGPVSLNTVLLTGVQSIDLDFGVSLLESGGEGELYTTFAGVQELGAVITIRARNVPWATYGLNGTALTAGAFYLRKLSTTGRVPNGTAQHIKFTATAGLIAIDETAAGGNTPAETTVRVTLVAPSAAGTSLTLDTASAIT